MRTTTKTKPRRTIEVINAGANRGALKNVDAFARWNAESTSVALVPHYIDPVPGRAALMKAEAQRHGVLAEGAEGTIEATIAAGDAKGKPILLNLDRPEAIARTILAAENTDSPILGFLLVKLPSGELWGVRFFIQAHDAPARRDGVIFFHRLATLTARRGSDAILGAGGSVPDRVNEPRYRDWFASHSAENLGKLVAGIEPTGNTFEITDDGVTTYSLLIHEAAAWSDPRLLAEEVSEQPPAAILRGESFCIAEITEDGIRFHKVRRRQVDDKVVLQGMSAIDTTSVDAERAAREAAEAMTRAERQTVSRRSPVLTTD